MSATLSPKAQTIEREFLAARAKSDHAAFAELARRYVKHYPEGVGKTNPSSSSHSFDIPHLSFSHWLWGINANSGVKDQL